MKAATIFRSHTVDFKDMNDQSVLIEKLRPLVVTRE
jgi:hypothetical protein